MTNERFTSCPLRAGLLLAALWLATALPAAHAQPRASLSLQTTFNTQTQQLEATVRLAARPKTGLGVSTIVFRFNPEAFTLPSRSNGVALLRGTDYVFHNGFGKKCYGGSTLTRPLKDEISINLDYVYFPFEGRCGVGGGRGIPKKGLDLVTVFFEVVNPAALTDLVFETEALITALYADDDDRRPTRFAVGSFEGARPALAEAGKAAMEAAEVPVAYGLSASYPNPFNPQTQMTLKVDQRQRVEVAVYDVLGRRVQTLYRGPLEVDRVQSLVFEAGELPSGLYVIRAVGEAFVETRTVMLVK